MEEINNNNLIVNIIYFIYSINNLLLMKDNILI